MRLFSRPGAVPDDVVRRASLEDGERVLAGVQDRNGRWCVGTERAMLLERDAGFLRLPWERVEQARWDQDVERLTVLETADWGETFPRHDLDLDAAAAQPGRLLELIRERVTASVLLRRQVGTDRRHAIEVVARRSPAGDGEVGWYCVLGSALDPDDPGVRARADAAVEQAREELGL